MARSRGGNPSPRPPSSRGVPSGECLWLPPHYGGVLRDKGGLDKAVLWGVGDVVDFVFPRRFQPVYHGVACGFLEFVLARGVVGRREVGEFLRSSGCSKSTLENKVIPKLVRFGFLKREREFKAGLGKGRGLVLSESLTFTSYLERVAFAWNMLVSTARQRRGRAGK